MNTQGVEPGAPAAGSPDDDDGADQGDHHGSAATVTAPMPRSHRRGMLAGLGVVGLLLAVLLLLGSGGSHPRLAAPGQHGHGPVTIPVRTADPAATTTTSAPQLTVPTAPAGHAFVTNASVRTSPRSAPGPTPTSSPGRTTPTTPSSSTTTTAPAAPPAPPATTTTTAPPTTTSTTSCILVVICG